MTDHGDTVERELRLTRPSPEPPQAMAAPLRFRKMFMTVA